MKHTHTIRTNYISRKDSLLMKYSLIALSVVSLSVHAEVPHTFTAGTPAKAVEVNENFEHLDSEVVRLETEATTAYEDLQSDIEVVESDLATLETTVGGLVAAGSGGGTGTTYSCGTDAYDHAYTYSRTVAELGTSVYLDGTEYRLTKYAVTAANGDLYHITMPKRVYSQTSPTAATYVRFSSYLPPAEDQFICDSDSIFGDAQFYYDITPGMFISRETFYSNDGDTDSYYYQNTSSIEAIQYNANITFGGMVMNVSAYLEGDEASILVGNHDYDFTDQVPVVESADYSAQYAEIAAFLNYIYIEKVE